MPRQQKNGMADAMLFFFSNENRFAGFSLDRKSVV